MDYIDFASYFIFEKKFIKLFIVYFR